MKAEIARTLVLLGPPFLGFLVLPPGEGIASFVAYELGLLAAFIARRNGIEIEFRLNLFRKG